MKVTQKEKVELIDYMKDKLGGVPMDGSDTNFHCAGHLIGFFRTSEEFKGVDPMAACKRLVDIALQDEFHKQYATSLSYVWGKKGKLILLGRKLKGVEVKQQGPYRIV